MILSYMPCELCRWFLAFDHTNVSRCLPVHDLVMWLSLHSGIFAFQRSIHQFSLMAKDQSHEHSNRHVQAGGGGLSDW